MKIGLDFDNTLVCYDCAFHAAASERGWLEGDVASSKQAVKGYLRGRGRNDDWTELQGYVYGPGMKNAEWFPGLFEFLRSATQQGWELCIVSHRTRHPYLGPLYELHDAARDWISKSDLLSEAIGLSSENIFFETTKEDKVARIKEVGADVFFDDLPEILQHENFPGSVQKILFDPNHTHPQTLLLAVNSWDQAMEVLTGIV